MLQQTPDLVILAMSLLSDPSDEPLARLVHALTQAVRIPLDPSERLHGLYLLLTLLFATGVYLRRRRVRARRRAPPAMPVTLSPTASARRGVGPGPLRRWVRFVFPRAVWSSPSAWLDVRYFFFHQTLKPWIAAPVGLAAAAAGYQLVGAVASPHGPSASPTPAPIGWGTSLLFFGLTTLLLDLAAYAIHRTQHRIGWLWEFHKVHHSATVMHPLTNYREHPVDNLVYALGLGFIGGAAGAAGVAWLGGLPESPQVAGAALFTFAFNALAYNLRHSHIWLAWRPHGLNRLIGSPAHHQVHHSADPAHRNRNFAFMFPIWDVLFGSYCLPHEPRRLRFGLGNGEDDDYRSCFGLYAVPLRKLWAARRTARRAHEPGAPARPQRPV